MELCVACESASVPAHRAVHLCRECTRALLRQLQHPRNGMARVFQSTSYARVCKVCGEYADRRLLEHPEWGSICEVEILEAAQVYRIEVQ